LILLAEGGIIEGGLAALLLALFGLLSALIKLFAKYALASNPIIASATIINEPSFTV